MEEVSDCIRAKITCEEQAINFLLRHAQCRMALTGHVSEDLLRRALICSRADAPAPPLKASQLQSKGLASSVNAPTPGVTKHDSCAERFSRAYAAARHISEPVHAPLRVSAG